MTNPSLRLLASSALFAATTVASAQAARPATAHRAAPAHTTAPAACVKVPDLSPKVPALPAGLGCPKPLYTITAIPSVKLDYVSPLEGPGLRESLGIEPSSFSLAYIDVKPGTGPLAAPHKWYTIHYTGYLVDGTKFDSSVDRKEPIVIQYGEHQVIPGWDTGFDGMRVGGKRRLFIPFQLAYGATPHGPIPAKSELIFDVEFIAQSDTKPEPKTPPAPPKPLPASAPGAAPSASPAPPAQPKPEAKPASPPPVQSTTPDSAKPAPK